MVWRTGWLPLSLASLLSGVCPSATVSPPPGCQHNDPFVTDGKTVRTRTNHAGGVLGGITTGMPLVVNVAVKPTASIGREQDTVDLQEMVGTTLVVHGRHDPCIVPRALPVVEAVTALTLLDMLMEE